jgi:hypothetical protein
VLDGGGGVDPPPDEDDELLELFEPPCDMQGCTAIVSVSVPFGTTTSLDPGGIGGVAPGVVLSASVQGGITTVRSACCWGITTVRTPGVWRAVETGSWLDDELELLLPHAASVMAIAAAPAAAVNRNPPLLDIVPPLVPCSSVPYPGAVRANGSEADTKRGRLPALPPLVAGVLRLAATPFAPSHSRRLRAPWDLQGFFERSAPRPSRPRWRSPPPPRPSPRRSPRSCAT